jgi:hypothetical protein
VADSPMAGKLTSRRVLEWGGSCLCIGGIVFLALRLGDYAAQFDVTRLDGTDICSAAALTLVYGISNMLLARAWWSILCANDVGLPWLTALRIYGISQIAKYVPGNVMHIALRQSMGLVAGLPGWALAKSSFWEIAAICCCGALFALLAAPLIWPPITNQLAGLMYLLAFLGEILFAGRLAGRHLAKACVWHTIFLLLSASVFLGALELIAGEAIAFPMVVAWGAAYVVAWLAGVVTPGAPAGLGVREAVLMLLLGGHIAGPDLLLAVLLSRLITVTGDGLFFAGSWALRRQATLSEKRP